MKRLLIYFLCILTMAACVSQKEIASPNDGPLFANEQHLTAVDGGRFALSYPEDKQYTDEQLYMNELLENKLPQDKMQVLQQWPSSVNYEAYYAGQQNKLSANGLAHLSKLYFTAYMPWELRYTQAAANKANPHLQLLINKQFTGYALLYNMLAWLKQGNDPAFQSYLQQVKTYAKPTIIPRDPSKPDSPELVDKPEMKQSLLRVLQSIEENNAAVEKIRKM